MKLKIMRKDTIPNGHIQVWVSRDELNCETFKFNIKDTDEYILKEASKRFNQIDEEKVKEVIEQEQQQILTQKIELIKEIDINALKQKLEITSDVTANSR